MVSAQYVVKKELSLTHGSIPKMACWIPGKNLSFFCANLLTFERESAPAQQIGEVKQTEPDLLFSALLLPSLELSEKQSL